MRAIVTQSAKVRHDPCVYRAPGAVVIVGPMNQFEGRVYLVSGASSGIGEAIAVGLRARGATVHGLASSEASCAKARERQPDIAWHAADVADRASLAGVVTGIGALDGIVNNAGIYEFAPLEASSEAMIRRQVDVNLLGAIFLAQAALPALRASRGTIVNVSSSAARKALPNQSVYAATKGALEALTRAWAGELAPSGIRVNAIAPGPTMTPGIARIAMPPEVMEQAKAQLLKTLPLGRTGTSEEVAHWAVLLSDPAVTWVTGQILGVDGGHGIG